MNGTVDFTFNPGQVYRRRELHETFGGQRQGGISTPTKVRFVLLITGDSGKQHGYSDEWTEDGLFLYTGEGQHGDMIFTKGNLAVRDHAANGKALHLFEQDKKDKRFLRYLGEMEYVKAFYRVAPDTNGKPRQAIVFQLRPVGTISPDSAVVAAALAGEVSGLSRRRGGGFGSVETNRRVEKAAIDFIKRHYAKSGWTVTSVEAEKVGYDLRCDKGDVQQHVEVKGTQGDELCFIITAAEVRNAMIDRRHVTCLVTAALTDTPKLFVFSRDEFISQLRLEPIGFRAQPRLE